MQTIIIIMMQQKPWEKSWNRIISSLFPLVFNEWIKAPTKIHVYLFFIPTYYMYSIPSGCNILLYLLLSCCDWFTRLFIRICSYCSHLIGALLHTIRECWNEYMEFSYWKGKIIRLSPYNQNNIMPLPLSSLWLWLWILDYASN